MPGNNTMPSDNPVPADAAARRAARRGTAAVTLAALLGAAAVSGAAAFTWWVAPYHDTLTGALTITASGSQQEPELIPVALVALAGLGATFATRGRARAAIGVLLAAAGLFLAVHSAISLGSEPTSVLNNLPRPATATGPAVVHPVGPAIAILGGLLIGAAGVLVLLGKVAGRGMGARYEAPSRPRAVDVQSDLWRALDAGADPTDRADPPDPTGPPDPIGPRPDGDPAGPAGPHPGADRPDADLGGVKGPGASPVP